MSGERAQFSARRSSSSACLSAATGPHGSVPGHGWLRDMGPDDQAELCLARKLACELDKFCVPRVLLPTCFCVAGALAAPGCAGTDVMWEMDGYGIEISGMLVLSGHVGFGEEIGGFIDVDTELQLYPPALLACTDHALGARAFALNVARCLLV